MRVVVVSKALVVASYRQKLTELSRLGVEVVAAVPAEWREGASRLHLEPASDEGYRLVVTPLRWNGHYHLHYYPALPALLSEVRPDLVHLDEEPYNLATYLGARAAVRSARPFLFFSYQNIVHRYPPPFSLMERSVYRSSAAALAAGPEAADVLRAKGYAKEVTIVPQVGVDPDVFAPGPRASGPFTVGFLNRLIPAKAPLLTLEAFSRLGADARLRVVGDGPLRPQLEMEIEKRGLSGRVSIEPRLPSSAMPDLLRSLDVVVLPSLTTRRWKEQFGRVLVEAMACGVPVIGSTSGEIPHVVGDAGLVVPEGDVGALAHALARLRDDRTLWRDLSCRGRRRVLDRFTNQHVARETLAAYERALSY